MHTPYTLVFALGDTGRHAVTVRFEPGRCGPAIRRGAPPSSLKGLELRAPAFTLASGHPWIDEWSLALPRGHCEAATHRQHGDVNSGHLATLAAATARALSLDPGAGWRVGRMEPLRWTTLRGADHLWSSIEYLPTASADRSAVHAIAGGIVSASGQVTLQFVRSTGPHARWIPRHALDLGGDGRIEVLASVWDPRPEHEDYAAAVFRREVGRWSLARLLPLYRVYPVAD